MAGREGRGEEDPSRNFWVSFSPSSVFGHSMTVRASEEVSLLPEKRAWHHNKSSSSSGQRGKVNSFSAWETRESGALLHVWKASRSFRRQ